MRKTAIRRLTSARLVACASPDYLRRAGRPETPSDLTRHACLICAEIGEPTRWRFQGPDGQDETLHVSGPVTSTNPEFVRQLALAGHRVILCPTFSVAVDFAEGRLTALLTDWRTREIPIHVLFPHRSLLSAKVRSFVDFLAEQFGSNPAWRR